MLKKDFSLRSFTSIWMFFIYGMAVFLEPIIRLVSGYNFFIRGGVYTLCIFFAEYVTGRLLSAKDICPWDYSHCKYQVDDVIRLDYAPVWFAAGLFFERLYYFLY